jgi:hypothetical protein
MPYTTDLGKACFCSTESYFRDIHLNFFWYAEYHKGKLGRGCLPKIYVMGGHKGEAHKSRSAPRSFCPCKSFWPESFFILTSFSWVYRRRISIFLGIEVHYSVIHVPQTFWGHD